MTRLALLVAAVFVALTSVAAPVFAQSASDLEISSKRYVVIDAETGEVFAERNADERVALASVTKVFTTIEALERGDLLQSITTNQSDVFDERSSLMGLGPDEVHTLEDLLFGMMLPSGNDAAHAIARALGSQPGDNDEESVDRFVGYMNERARNMGLTNTNFVNPHGWGVDGHYSSAKDIATFVMYALRFPKFREIIGTSEFTTSDGSYYLLNNNRLLGGYPGLIGGKTGLDDDSGYCLVEAAERDGNTMISVTLDGEAPDIWYQDNAVLLDFAFEAKADREASGAPIETQQLSYRDPDAALIAVHASSGGSISDGVAVGVTVAGGNVATPGAIAAIAPNNPDVQPVEQSVADRSNGDAISDSNKRFSMLGVAFAALLLLGFGAWRTFFGGDREAPSALATAAASNPESAGPSIPDQS